MGKPIPNQIKAAFERFAENIYNDTDINGNFSTYDLDFINADSEEWEFAPNDDDIYDFYDLFNSSSKFQAV